MLKIFVFVCPFLISIVSANTLMLPEKTTVQIHPETVLVIFGTKHGNRNPEKFISTANLTWGQEGVMELTQIGKRQTYGLGREIRSFIGTFINENFLPGQSKFFSSSSNRAQMTLQLVLASLFDPEEWADWNTDIFDHWSPVPYTIDDSLLQMNHVKECVHSGKVWEPILQETLPDLKVLSEQFRPLLKYMKEKDARAPTIKNAADIADNIINMDFNNATYPEWLANPTLPGYTSSSIRTAFKSFSEMPERRCAAYKPCREMMGGLWADHIVKALESAVSGSSETRLIGYASHTQATLSVMILLGIDKTELTTSAGFIIELRNATLQNEPHVRLLQHDPNPIDAHVIYPARLVQELAAKADSEGWMPLSVLNEYASRSLFSNWKCVCGMIDSCNM